MHIPNKAPCICSVFTAETNAIQHTLKWVENINSSNSVILTDSLSVFHFKKKTLLPDFIATLYMVEAPVGIVGNELVDSAAKKCHKFRVL